MVPAAVWCITAKASWNYLRNQSSLSGGSETIDLEHNHNQLTTNEEDAHTHTQDDTNASGSHSHSKNSSTPSGTPTYKYDRSGPSNAGSAHIHSVITTTESDHTHTNPETGSGGLHSHQVNISDELSSSQNIEPLFYVIQYIMRMS